MERISRDQISQGKPPELSSQTNHEQIPTTKSHHSLFREMYNLRPYRIANPEQTNLHLHEISFHQGEKIQIQLETDVNEINTLSNQIVLDRLKSMHTSIDPSKDSSPSLIDQAYYEAKALMTDMIEYPVNNAKEYYNMSEEDFNRFSKNKESITRYQQELNALTQFSGVYFHSNQYVQTDAFKEETIKLYKDISKKVLGTYKDCTPIQAIWKYLHGMKETVTQEQFIQTDIISDLPRQLTEDPAASAIRNKGWDITPLPENNSIYELIKTNTAEELTHIEIENFYQEQHKTKLKNTVREGLKKLIKDKKLPLDPLKKAKNALDKSPTNDIFHWEQPKSPKLWYIQNQSTGKIHVGVAARNNLHKIEANVIHKLNTTDRTKAYSTMFKADFTRGINEDNIIKTTDNIAISIEYYPSKTSEKKPIYVVITDTSEIFITDNINELSRKKYQDPKYIPNKKISTYPDPNWIFHEIDPW